MVLGLACMVVNPANVIVFVLLVQVLSLKVIGLGKHL